MSLAHVDRQDYTRVSRLTDRILKAFKRSRIHRRYSCFIVYRC